MRSDGCRARDPGQARPGGLLTAWTATWRGNWTGALRAGAEIILGKEWELRLAIACLLARGHLLIEDLPGVGKTTLAHLLARLLGLDYARIQTTSDLPAAVKAAFRWPALPCRYPAR